MNLKNNNNEKDSIFIVLICNDKFYSIINTHSFW